MWLLLLTSHCCWYKHNCSPGELVLIAKCFDPRCTVKVCCCCWLNLFSLTRERAVLSRLSVCCTCDRELRQESVQTSERPLFLNTQVRVDQRDLEDLLQEWSLGKQVIRGLQKISSVTVCLFILKASFKSHKSRNWSVAFVIWCFEDGSGDSLMCPKGSHMCSVKI